MKLRTDDTVVVISGKDKGKTGRILRVDLKKDKVFVEGLNIVKRHQRPTPGRPDAVAGVIEREGPIHVSNVMLLDPRKGTPTRSKRRIDADGTKERISAKSGEAIPRTR